MIKHNDVDSAYIGAVLNYITSYSPIPSAIADQFREAVFQVSYKKGTYLLRQGEHATAFYFIISGIVVGYTTKKKKKLTTYICAEGDTISSINGMYGEKPSGESMYVIEDAILLGLSVNDLLNWIATSFEWNVIVRKILEDFYKIAHERSNIIRMGTAQEKYEYYAAEMSNHFDRIPVEYIADYLNIKPKTLEKLLKERQNTRNPILTENIHGLIRLFLVEKQGFREQDLTLSKMAGELSLPAHQLSHFINFHYKKSFNSLINTYRVIYLRHQLQQYETWQHLKIEAMGINGGFSSRSLFFAEFKLRIGMSPAEYAKTIQKMKL